QERRNARSWPMASGIVRRRRLVLMMSIRRAPGTTTSRITGLRLRYCSLHSSRRLSGPYSANASARLSMHSWSLVLAWPSWVSAAAPQAVGDEGKAQIRPELPQPVGRDLGEIAEALLGDPQRIRDLGALAKVAQQPQRAARLAGLGGQVAHPDLDPDRRRAGKQ